MRIAFVTQWFPPEQGTTVAAAIAEGLAGRGHDVDVLTGFPNYPTGHLHPDYPLRPYRRDRLSDRVTVHRAPLYPSHDHSAPRRAANYLSFAASASWVARRRLSRPDVWLTYSSPATASLPSMTVPRSLRAPSYLLLQDLWPDSVTGSGLVQGRAHRVIERGMGRYCDLSYRKATGIGVISPSMATILISRGVPPDKIHQTPNWVSDRDLQPDLAPSDAVRSALGLPLGRLFMYAGNLGQLQGLGPLLDAFASCPAAHLVLIGAGVARPGLEAQVRRSGCTNVTFRDPVPTNEIGRYIAASDVQVVSLQDTALLRATMPSKVQTSMAAGRAVLAHAAGDVADLVTRTGSGVATPPGDLASAVAAITMLTSSSAARLETMGRSARSHYERHFSPAVGVERLESMLCSHLNTERQAQ